MATSPLNGFGDHNQVPDDLVAKVGAAAGKVALIQESYTAAAQSDPKPEARNALAMQARMEAEQAIDDQGLSIEDYNAVLVAAETDPELESRLVDAARKAL